MIAEKLKICQKYHISAISLSKILALTICWGKYPITTGLLSKLFQIVCLENPAMAFSSSRIK